MFKNLTLKSGLLWLAGFATLVVVWNSFYTVDGGEYYIEQPPSGKLIPVQTPGIKFKVPFATKLTKYDEVTTVTYNNKQNGALFSSDKSSNNPPFAVNFADTYSGLVTGSFRVELPRDPDQFIALHKAFKHYDNLVDNGYEKLTNQLLSYTANQFTGENYMQGGQNEYQIRLKDQADRGIYITKRVKKRINTAKASVGLDNENPNKLSQQEAIIWINEVQTDENGTIKRNANPLDEYGVKITQVTIDGFYPEDKLKDFIDNKKVQVQKRAKLVEEQENERQSAITAELKGNRERVEARQAMLKEKDSAVIEADKRVELERKAAELQVVLKQKELDIAIANERIQKAAEKAAKYEAQAKLHNGLADARILKAKYDAYDKTLYSMEIQRDTMIKVTENLKGITVAMPKVNIQGGSGGNSMNSVDTVLQAIGVQKLEEIAKGK